jgi:histidinol phosphatase-like enzyme
LCIDANQNNEVRTLFPKINVSVFPLSIYEERNSWEDYEQMKNAILKIFEFDQKYLKSRRILFALEERYDFNRKLSYSILEEVLSDKNLYSITCSVYVL